MKTIYLNNDTHEQVACVAAIGMFDGVHLGHRFVINHVCHEAHKRGLLSCIITFDRHPKQVIQAENAMGTNFTGQLTTLDERLLLLSRTDVDVCVVLPFTQQMAALSARDFMQHVLKEQLCVNTLLIGYDNRFGHPQPNHRETFEDYQRYGHELGIDVVALRAAGNVSSSTVRCLLAEGDVAAANERLGYPYFLTGTVVNGEHIGTNLGFPTANLETAPDKLIPAPGVYAVRVRLEASVEQKHGMMNIGERPTFDGQQTTLEVNIFRFWGDLYGQQMSISFIDRIRPEQRFDSPEALAEQLRKDAEAAEHLLIPTDSTRRPEIVINNHLQS